MLGRKLGILLLLICYSLLKGVAQDPSHYFLGEEKLSGLKIYDIIQDKEQDFWIATDQGLYSFDGYQFKSIQHSSLQSNSVFNLRMTDDGTIYFNDLKNHIFCIRDGQIESCYTIEENEGHYNTYLETKGNQVYIQAENLTILGQDTIVVKYDLHGSRISFYLLEDGTTICATQKQVCKQLDSEVSTFDLEIFQGKIVMPNTWITIEGQVYAIDHKSMNLFRYDNTKQSFEFVKQLTAELNESRPRAYRVGDQIWVAGNRNGIFAFDLNWNELYNGKILFEDYLISDIYQDIEGSILLGTFDNGIIVVPNLDHVVLTLSGDEKILDFSFDGDSTIFIGTSLGSLIAKNIYTYEEKLLYQSFNAKPIETVYYAKKDRELFFTSPKGFGVGQWQNGNLILQNDYSGSIKSATTSEGITYIALNNGVKELALAQNTSSSNFGEQTRAYDVAFDNNTSSLYVVYSTGLKIFNEDKQEIPLEGKDPTDKVTQAEGTNEYIFLGTSNGKVLICQDKKVIDFLEVSSSVRKMKANNGRLFIRTLEDAFLYDITNQELTALKRSLGYDKNKIIDGYISDSLLLLSTSNGVSIQPIQGVEQHFPALKVSISGFYQNGLLTTDSHFDYSSSVYGVSFKTSTIRYADNVTYRYKLIGFDDDWKYVDFESPFVKFGSLPPGEYTIIAEVLNGDQVSDPATYSFEIEAPFYQKLWFYLIILLVVAALFYMVYKIRIRAINVKNQEVVEKQKMQTNLLEMELKALRSQMNPHFIFNSLNSIQSLVLKEDIDNSYDYLVLFAKLVRNTLNYSDLNAIPIEKEIEFLEVYLSLEQLRFKKDLNYEIVFDEATDFSIPPLIIQPFVENALVHGLLHKEGEKKLKISFKLEHHLTVTITDNGVGRELAQRIEDRSKLSEHKSFAMNAIQQRLDLLNKQLNEDIGSFTIEDLYNEGKPAGTRVTLRLPVQYLY